MHRTESRPSHPPAGPVLDSERGAFDLPSIITGVVVVGVLTAGVLASIFGVIPFAQDNGAKQDLAAINTAQAAARVTEGRFLDSDGLRGRGYISASSRLETADSGGFVRVAATEDTTVLTNEAGTCYVALSRSGTGEIFVASDTRRDPRPLTPLAQEACIPTPALQSAANAVGGFKTTYIPDVPAGLASQSVTSSNATFTWGAVADATGYRVESRVNTGAWTVFAENQPATTAIIPAPGNSSVELRVAARNAAGASAASQSVSVVLPAANTYTWSSAAAPVTNYAGMTTNADGSLRVYASGYNMYLSKDSGKTWPITGASVPKGQYTTWSDPQIVCGARITAYGGTTQWFSTNAGGSYTNESVGSPCNIPAVKSSDGRWKIYTTETATYHNGYYVTYDTTIVFTGAAGTKATSITNSMGGHSQRVRSVAVGEDGLHAAYLTTNNSIVATADGGVTWTPRTPGTGTTFVAMAPDAKRFAAIKAGQLYTTINSGATWKLETDAGTGLNWVGFSADGKTLTAEKNGTRYTGAFG